MLPSFLVSAGRPNVPLTLTGDALDEASMHFSSCSVSRSPRRRLGIVRAPMAQN